MGRRRLRGEASSASVDWNGVNGSESGIESGSGQIQDTLAQDKTAWRGK